MMNMTFTLQDFLEIYYNNPISSIESGIYLLSKLDDDTSKHLLGELKSLKDYNYNCSQEEKERVTKILTKVKCWLISNY